MPAVTFHVVVVPQYDNRDQIIAARVDKMTQAMPNGVAAGGIVIRMCLDVPDEAFRPLEAKMTVEKRQIVKLQSPEVATIELAKELAS